MRLLFLPFEKLYFNRKINYVYRQLFQQNFINIKNCLQFKWCHILQKVNHSDFEKVWLTKNFFHIDSCRTNDAHNVPSSQIFSLFHRMCEYVTQGNAADVIKMNNLLVLKLGHYLRLCRVVRGDHKGP